MPITYGTIEKRVGDILNLFGGTIPSAAETNYNTVSYNNSFWPQAAVRDAILDAEIELLWTICNDAGNPHRFKFLTLSANFLRANVPIVLPSTDATGRSFVGPLEVVRTSTNEVLVPESLTLIKWINETGSFFTDSYPYYAIIDGLLYFTVDEAKVRGATPQRASSFVPGNNTQIVEGYANKLVARAVTMLTGKEGAFADVAALYDRIYHTEDAAGRFTGRTVQPTSVPFPA